MRVDCKAFRNCTCKKCNRYSEKPIFGKCLGDKKSIYNCARMKMFNRGEFKRWTGINIEG